MRTGIISDTHGNFTALQAVLDDMKKQGVERILFLGDAATIGAQPNETLDALRALDCPCIMGNHDEAVLHPEHATELQIAAPLHASLRWSIQNLRRENIEFLRTFQPTCEVQMSPEISMLCFHGSPLSNTDIILATTPAESLDWYFAGQVSSIWVGGHTHVQLLRRYGDRLLLNPGSVGNAFKHAYVSASGVTPELLPWAEYAVLEVEGKNVSVDLRRVPFDTRKVLDVTRASGNPSTDWWLAQYK